MVYADALADAPLHTYAFVVRELPVVEVVDALLEAHLCHSVVDQQEVSKLDRGSKEHIILQISLVSWSRFPWTLHFAV